MYIIEGNIGAGKTTFLRLISQILPEINPCFEPKTWRNEVVGESLLNNFYQNPKRWAYTMEIFAMTSRAVESIKEQSKTTYKIKISERSIYSGHYCFAINGQENGYFTLLEWQIYLNWFNFIATKKNQLPKGFIYLKVDPEKALERVKKRNRSSETEISLEYLKQIDNAHETFLINKIGVIEELKSIPVLTIDCNLEFESDKEIMQKYAKTIKEFILKSI
ncbi:deoxynucleoside kinase [Candidatus Babela massiliensis]|uniref:Deoxynucleoside kinase n=1 Tax=Candidatus Babela massiliensis TaxID=673862 RepID=V6DIT1_9BACT|nr:deoxynucleoside kinase [Candidatus Babela massiliensis]CDK30843.1 Deoxynucleoside kinase [Candidatus Babela massiliensis]